MRLSNEEIKQKTLELYDSLPMDLEERLKCIDVRDKVLELNMAFFGYVASHTFINNPSITYEDKFQSACCAFLDMWWKFKYAPKYRTDLSFSVFFRPRIAEVIERNLNEVKYSIRRSLCMEVGKQLNKHWAQVRYEDLSNNNLHLPVNKLNSLKSIFGTLYVADLEQHELYIEADKVSTFKLPSDNYNSIQDLLVYEMVYREAKLSDSILLEIADMYTLDFWELKKILPSAELKLYNQLHESIDIQI